MNAPLLSLELLMFILFTYRNIPLVMLPSVLLAQKTNKLKYNRQDMCVCARVCSYVQACVHVRVCTSVRARVSVYLCTSVRVRASVYLCASVRARMRAYVCVCVRVLMCVRMCVYALMCCMYAWAFIIKQIGKTTFLDLLKFLF